MRILIVEDEVNLARVVAERLECENFDVEVSHDGEEGLQLARSGSFDLLILDVMLPSLDGFEILAALRRQKNPIKIIMLTARSAVSDRLTGLKGGADDYLTKPFHLEELVARINLQLRKETTDDGILRFGDLELDTKNPVLTCPTTGRSVEMVRKEFLLLEYLMRNSDRICTKEILFNNIWGSEHFAASNNLEVYVSFVRKKIKAIGAHTKIKALRGLGYKLEAPRE